MKKLASILFSFIISLCAFADQVSNTVTVMSDIGQPTYLGSGCPADGLTVALSLDRSTLSIQFNNDTTVAGGTSSRPGMRKACLISIPITSQNGACVAVTGFSASGSNNIPCGGQSRFDVQYSFAGTTYAKETATFEGALNQGFSLLEGPNFKSSPYSCSSTTLLVVETSLSLLTNNNLESAWSRLNTINFKLKWAK